MIVLSTVTLFVYAWFWWYFINRELRDLGRARGSTELGDNPTLSALAVSLGSLIIVPPFVSAYNTCKRIQAAQRLSGESEPLNGWLALALFAAMFFVYIPFAFGYIQSELNKVWRNQEVTDPVSPELMHPGAMRGDPGDGAARAGAGLGHPHRGGSGPGRGPRRRAAGAASAAAVRRTGIRIPGTRPGCATGTAATGPATRRPEARPAPVREPALSCPNRCRTGPTAWRFSFFSPCGGNSAGRREGREITGHRSFKQKETAP